jgi:hypothetical protein
VPRSAIAILLVFLATAAVAQDQPLTLRLMGADSAEAHTRQTLTFVLAAGNDSLQRRSLGLEYILPEGWKALT